MKRLIAAIKDKKELRSLDDDFVMRAVEDYFSQHKKLQQELEVKDYNPKSAVFKIVVKDIRAKLREIYGVFQAATNEKRKKWLNNYFDARGRGERMEALNKLLMSHQSTAERTSHYPTLYKELFAITGTPDSILDLGCGFNPFSYDWLGCAPHYVACDISSEDISLIKEFFMRSDIDGEARVVDLLQKPPLPQADMVLMLKLVDTLESQSWNISKEVIKNMEFNWLIVSFPTISIGGRKMREGGKENWFSRWLDQQGWSYRTMSIPGEEFWIIKH